MDVYRKHHRLPSDTSFRAARVRGETITVIMTAIIVIIVVTSLWASQESGRSCNSLTSQEREESKGYGSDDQALTRVWESVAREPGSDCKNQKARETERGFSCHGKSDKGTHTKSNMHRLGRKRSTKRQSNDMTKLFIISQVSTTINL